MRLYDALRLTPSDVVAFVGGGGKTTAMFRLASEIVARGGRVVTTTTTRIFAAQTKLAPFHIVLDDPARLPPELPRLLQRRPNILLAGPIDAESGKASGLPAELVSGIQSASGHSRAVVLVEADGSRMRPMKAPAAHEPVIPASTTVVVPVVGVDAVGKPLDDVHVHRAERAARLLQMPVGTVVTPEMVARLLLHAEAGRKAAPAGARFVPLVNKVAGHGHLLAAREISAMLLDGAVDEVLLAAAREDDPVVERWGRVSVVLLAAGASTRMAAQGEIKQLLPWGGQPLVAHAADQALASEASGVVVVVGHQAERVLAALAAREVIPARNEGWADGQSTSVRAGLRALPAGTQAALFMLVDQPRVGSRVIDAVVQRYRETGAPIVAPRAAGRRANPVLFDRSTWPELEQLEGDTGGRPLFEAHADRVEWVEWGDEILAEIDTPDEYARLLDREADS